MWKKFNITKIFSSLEKERLNFLEVFIVVILLAATRMWVEAELYNYPYKKLYYEYIFTHFHIISYYVSVFLGGVLILKFFTKEKLIKIANLSSIGFIIILFPPLIDHFIFNVKMYSYIPRKFFLDALLFNHYKLVKTIGGWGLLFQLYFIVIASSLYTYYKTHSIKRVLSGAIIMYLFIVIMGTPTLDPLINEWKDTPFRNPIFLLRYLILSSIFLLLILKVSGKKLLSSFVKSSAPFRTLHGIIMVLIGVIVSNHINIDFSHIQSYENAASFGVIGISLFLIVFLWKYTVWINNIYDIEIDRIVHKDRILVNKRVSIDVIKNWAIILAILSIGLAFSLGMIQFILSIIAIFLGTIYSIPPFRLRNSIISSIFVGMGSLIAFLIGYFAPSLESVAMNGLYVNGIYVKTYGIERSFPPVNYETLVIGLLILIVFSIGPLLRDLEDYEGDKKAGVKNIFTIYGKRKGIKITSILLFLSFISPLLLFRSLLDIIIFISIGTISSLYLVKFEKTKFIFILYSLILLYCIFRFLWFNI